MLRIDSTNTTSINGSHNKNVSSNFGTKLEELNAILSEQNTTGKSTEEFNADKFERIAQMVSDENIETEGKAPNTLKSFTVIGALASASALTAAAISGRVFNFINSSTPTFNLLSRNIAKGITKFNQKMAEKRPYRYEGIKAKAVQYAKDFGVWIDDMSKKGVEANLKNAVNKDQSQLDLLKRTIIEEKGGKALTEEQLQSEIQKAIEKEKNQILGSNILKKGVKTVFASTAGVGALKEAATDTNKDGIPDCVQKKDAHKNATKQVTAAIIDAALDSVA